MVWTEKKDVPFLKALPLMIRDNVTYFCKSDVAADITCGIIPFTSPFGLEDSGSGIYTSHLIVTLVAAILGYPLIRLASISPFDDLEIFPTL